MWCSWMSTTGSAYTNTLRSSITKRSRRRTAASRQQPPCRPAQPSLTLHEPLRITGAALLATEPGRRLHLLGDVDAVVIAEPGELALVSLEHRDLDVDRLGDVDVLRRLEPDAHDRLHVVDRRDEPVMRPARLEQRERRVEAAVEDELRDLVVVRHVVTRVVGDDQVGPGGAHEVDDEPALIRVRRV